VLARVDLHGARCVRNDAWEDGVASSLRAGLAALDACGAAVVVLGDGPLLSQAAIERVAEALRRGAQHARAVYADGDRHGHPVGIARALWERVPGAGEAGGRALGPPDVLVDCADLPAPGDVDVPETLPECRSGGAGASEG
jgi:nicotine blue oxidoreductase